MNILISREIQDKVQLVESDSVDIDTITNVRHIVQEEKQIILLCVCKDLNLKEYYPVTRFMFNNKKFKFKKELVFNFRSLKKDNNMLVLTIFIDKSKFWEGLSDD